MSAGQRRHRVTIQAPPGVVDETGNPVVLESSVPMQITVAPLGFQSQESLTQPGGGLRAQTIYTLNCAYRDDVKTFHQVIEECCTQRQFEILAVTPTDRRDALDLRCVTST
jgi:hypothetical protein